MSKKNIVLFTLMDAAILFVIVGIFFLPQPHVERSISLPADAATVFQHVHSPRAFHQWSPWAKIDPNMSVQFSGPESGAGAKMQWTSDNADVGNGSSTVTMLIPNERVEFALDLGKQGQATSYFQLSPEGENTVFTWGFDMDTGKNPITRWFGLLMDSIVGADYEKGLENLKTLIVQETNSTTPATPVESMVTPEDSDY